MVNAKYKCVIYKLKAEADQKPKLSLVGRVNFYSCPWIVVGICFFNVTFSASYQATQNSKIIYKAKCNSSYIKSRECTISLFKFQITLYLVVICDL